MVIKNAEFVTSYGLQAQLPKGTKKEIVMSGRSNVGKSSLINKVCNRKNLARTSSQPGKTVTVNFYNVNDFHMVDLPGYGFAKVGDKDRKRWGRLIDGYFESDRDLRLVVQLLDCRHEPSRDDYTMLDYLTVREIPFIIALTKADKLNKTESEKVVAKFEELCSDFNYYKIVLTSSDKGTGIEELKSIFEEVLEDYDEETEDGCELETEE